MNPITLKTMIKYLFIFLPVAVVGMWTKMSKPGTAIRLHTIGAVVE